MKLDKIREKIAKIIYPELTQEEELLVPMGSHIVLPANFIKRIQDEWVKDGLIR